MEYVGFLLAELAVFALGFFLGQKTKLQDDTAPLTDEEKRILRERQEQWDNLMQFTGRDRK
jgi:hypothetical protein